MASPYFTVIAEDRAHELFVYRTLVRWGVATGRIRSLPFPAGKGSGEQFVRMNLPRYLREIRKATSARFLVAVTDADTAPVAERRQQIDAAVKEVGDTGLTSSDPAVLLVPKRHVEAWFDFLMNGTIDEARDYDHAFNDRLAEVCKVAAARLDEWLDAGAPTAAPPSLLVARADLLRLREAARS